MHQDIMLAVNRSEGLAELEARYPYRLEKGKEFIDAANNNTYKNIAEIVFPDPDALWRHPLAFYLTHHNPSIGGDELGRKALEYLDICSTRMNIKPLSVTTVMNGPRLELFCLVRLLGDRKPNMSGIHDYLGEFSVEKQPEAGLIIPPGTYINYTPEEIESHRETVKHQNEALLNSTKEKPFLNSIDKYSPWELPEKDPRKELLYDLQTKDRRTKTKLPYEDFIRVFDACMNYVSTIERDSYYDVIRGRIPKEQFLALVQAHVTRMFINTGKLPTEDLPALFDKLERALFQLYIVQDLIDDPRITDIKITAPDSIRVRVDGKAFLSNVTFINREDYERFINSIAVKNNIDLNEPTQTFTDEHDENYILRFSITAPYISSTGIPTIHVRKVPRKKLMADDLIRMGMMDEKLRDYLLDCGKHSDGIVFAGPPGSGKTVMLNWFLEEAYESEAEILVIQENDELFTSRKGVMFQHVVNNPQHGERACTLEDLGKMALVAGANVFVIGEAKGAEICSAITLSNSGCRTAITIHSPSATKTIDKMADLAMRGYAQSYKTAKKMITSFQTIVYLQDFKVQEITEIEGWDPDADDIIYRPIYKRDA